MASRRAGSPWLGVGLRRAADRSGRRRHLGETCAGTCGSYGRDDLSVGAAAAHSRTRREPTWRRPYEHRKGHRPLWRRLGGGWRLPSGRQCLVAPPASSGGDDGWTTLGWSRVPRRLHDPRWRSTLRLYAIRGVARAGVDPGPTVLGVFCGCRASGRWRGAAAHEDGTFGGCAIRSDDLPVGRAAACAPRPGGRARAKKERAVLIGLVAAVAGTLP